MACAIDFLQNIAALPSKINWMLLLHAVYLIDIAVKSYALTTVALISFVVTIDVFVANPFVRDALSIATFEASVGTRFMIW